MLRGVVLMEVASVGTGAVVASLVPVSKHGPRSHTHLRVEGCKTHGRTEREWCQAARLQHRPLVNTHVATSEFEQMGVDPIACDLRLGRMKSGETLMEVRRGSDVQIDPQTWVKE